MNATGQHTPRSAGPGAGGAGAGTSVDGAQRRMPPRRVWLWFLLVLLANVLIGRMLAPDAEAPAMVPYTLFRQEVGKNNVHAIFGRGETISGRFKAPVVYPSAGSEAAPPGRSGGAWFGGSAPPEPREVTAFKTTLPSFVDRGLEAFLIEHGVEISAKPIQEERSTWATLLYSLGPALLGLVLEWLWVRDERRDSVP